MRRRDATAAGTGRDRIACAARRAAPRRGFTLVEVLLALAVGVLVVGGMLALFTASSELTRDQTQVANMQQSLRLAQGDLLRSARMSGRGPLPQATIGIAAPQRFDLLALAVRNNVGAAEHIAAGDIDTPRIVAGTDVLTLRGVFGSPIYQLHPAGSLTLDDPGAPTAGSLLVAPTTPAGIPQDLQPLEEMIDGWSKGGYEPEALLVVSPADDSVYAIVEIQPGSSYGEHGVTLEFKISGGAHTEEFAALSAGGGYPQDLDAPAFVAVLEEHRFYVREEYEIPGDDTSPLDPRLSRARLYPGTEVAHLYNPESLAVDVADDVLDLQVALGIDTGGDALLVEHDPPDGDDDWLFNSADDDATDPRYALGAPGGGSLYYLRLNTLVRTDRPDRGFEAALLAAVEDKDYTTAPGATYNTAGQRAFRRRWMRTVIDTRNVS